MADPSGFASQQNCFFAQPPQPTQQAHTAEQQAQQQQWEAAAQQQPPPQQQGWPGLGDPAAALAAAPGQQAQQWPGLGAAPAPAPAAQDAWPGLVRLRLRWHACAAAAALVAHGQPVAGGTMDGNTYLDGGGLEALGAAAAGGWAAMAAKPPDPIYVARLQEQARAAAAADAAARAARNESWAKYKAGLGAVLHMWSALQLAIENKWGGDGTHAKVELFKDELVDVFARSKNVDKYDMDAFLVGFMFDHFNSEIEDNSGGEVGGIRGRRVGYRLSGWIVLLPQDNNHRIFG